VALQHLRIGADGLGEVAALARPWAVSLTRAKICRRAEGEDASPALIAAELAQERLDAA
jgi:hypothetical protein